MASFVQRALMYLGLKDIDDEDDYDGDDEDDVLEPATEPRPPEHISRARAANGRRSRRCARSRATTEPSCQTPVARGAVVRPFVTQRHSKPQVVAPARFSDAQEIGDMVKANMPVIVNLQASEKDLARRMIDFCSGLTYAVGGSMEKVAESVFLLTPSNVEVLRRGTPAPARERAVPVLKSPSARRTGGPMPRAAER